MKRWASFRDEKKRFKVRKLLGFVFGPDSPYRTFRTCATLSPM